MTKMQALYFLLLLVLSCATISFCGEHPDGISSVSREQDALGNYRFSYSVSNSEGEQFRKEGTDESGRVVGSYGLTHADGTSRVVDYVADKDGFRAAVRSNEPGVASAEPADAPIVNPHSPLINPHSPIASLHSPIVSHHSAVVNPHVHIINPHAGDSPLTVAATSNDDKREPFGKRLPSSEEVVPGVEYVSSSKLKTPDEEAKESRHYNFDDYRPLSPVAYYPGSDRPLSDPQTLPHRPLSNPETLPHRQAVERQRSPRVLQQSPEADPKPIDVYFPPIDPHTGRRPPYYPSQDRNSDRNVYPTVPTRRPFIPPYGGFDDEPESRRPGISMTTIHGGFGSRRDFPTPAPNPLSRFPSVRHSPDQRDFGRPQFPSRSSFPSAIPPPTSGILPSYPRGILPRPPSQSVLFNPPSYDDGDVASPPNFVLRAVPIPNGIQAVRVDPISGSVYERLMYPLFLRHDGYPAYDRNILLHNDEIGDDDASRDFDHSGNFDISFPNNDSPFRGTRNPSFSRDEVDRTGRSRRYNNTYAIDERNLSQPTAGDMAWIQRQLSQVEGFERDGFDNRVLPDSENRDSNFRIDEDRTPFRNSRSSSRIRSLPDRVDFDADVGSFSRNPRNSDLLTVGDSNKNEKIIAESTSHSKQIETEGKSSNLEKE